MVVMPENTAEINAERIRLAIETQRIDDAVKILLEMHKADQAEVFDLLSEEEQDLLLPLMESPAAADLLEELDDEDVLEAIDALSPKQLASVLDEMEPDEAADLLGDLPPETVSEALSQMSDADEVIPLLGFPDETAGGLMTTSYIALHRTATTEEAINFLRQIHPDTEIPYYLYVIDREKRLIGIVGFRELVISEPSVRMDDIMEHEVIYVTSGSDQEDVARIMTRYDLAAIPVVDDQQRLMGVITHDDITDVLQEEATEDIYRLANVTDTDLDPQSPIWEQIKGRLPWVYLNTVTALFASWVISNFQGLIGQVAILAAFQSIVAGLGGNTASQNVAMIVRALALGKMDEKKIWMIIAKQVLIGVLQGAAVGVVVGIGVGIWQANLYLGLILALAMIGNMIVAGVIGTLVPLALRSFGQDPALASSVLVTAATDSAGFFIFLSLASLFIQYLV
jgi:magnesium transporter